MTGEGRPLREGYRDVLIERLDRGGGGGRAKSISERQETRGSGVSGGDTKTRSGDLANDSDSDDSYVVGEADKSFILTNGDVMGGVKRREDDAGVKIEEGGGEGEGEDGIDSHRYLDLENDENDYEDSEYNDDLFDDDFDEDYEYEDYEHEDGPSRTKFLWSRFLLVITIIVAIILTILPGVSLSKLQNISPKISIFPNFNTGPLSSTSLSNMQKQITHLYSELSIRDQKYKSEFDERLKLIMSQFEKQIKALLPTNIMKYDKEIKTLQLQLKQLQNLVESRLLFEEQQQQEGAFKVTIDNVTQWETQLLSALEEQLPERIPVIIDDSQRVLIIPELHRYVAELVSQVVESGVNIQRQEQVLLLSDPEYDLSKYFKEILNDQFQFVDKQYFIEELNSTLEKTKQEIWDEFETYLKSITIRDTPRDTYENNNNNIPEQYSSIVIKKLVDQFYNDNQYQWDTDLDFATYTQGTRLVQRLTSTSYQNGNGLSATQLLLLNSPPSTSSSSYWQCSTSETRNCSFTIHFNRPIYLTKLSYLHGRLKNNLHIMNSAPRQIAVYILLEEKKKKTKTKTKEFTLAAHKHNAGQQYQWDPDYIKIATYQYQLESPQLNQVFNLPLWYIKQRPLVRSLMFVVEKNYGNRRYVSLRKFIVNGVLEEDLGIMMMNRDNDKNNFMSSKDNDFWHWHQNQNNDDDGESSGRRGNRYDRVPPAFGQDELIS